MALSDSFIQGFERFIQKYKQDAKGGWFGMGQDVHYERLSTNLDGLLTLLRANQPLFIEQAVCDYINRTALLGAQSNPAFASIWQQSLSALAHDVSTLLDDQIAILSQGGVGESIAQTVRKVLPDLQRFQEELQQSQQKVEALQAENQALREKLEALTHLAATSGQLDALQHEVDALSLKLADIRASLVDVPKERPTSEVPESPIPPAPEMTTAQVGSATSRHTPQTRNQPTRVLASDGFFAELQEEFRRRANHEAAGAAAPEKK